MSKAIHKNTEERIERILHGYEEQVLHHINEEYTRQTRKSDRIADKIAEFGGSWRFIIIFGCFLAAWMIWNVVSPLRFDPYPFILLNLVLSFTAAFQAPIIMMSQNRQAARDKQETMVDFAVNFKAEQEIDDIQGHLHRGEAAVGRMLQMQKQYQQQLDDMRAENEKTKRELLEQIHELKNLLQQG